MDFKQDQEIVSTFISETIDHLEELEYGILTLENGGGHHDGDLVHSMFRAAHSIKAGANLLEFRDIELLSYAIENMLQKLRLEYLVLDSNMATVFLQALDMVRELLDDPNVFDSGRISLMVKQMREAIDQ